MSQETARYVLWGLMCLPVFALWLYFYGCLKKDKLGISRAKQAKRKVIEDEKQRIEGERRRREIFDEDYREYQRKKYSDERYS